MRSSIFRFLPAVEYTSNRLRLRHHFVHPFDLFRIRNYQRKSALFRAIRRKALVIVGKFDLGVGEAQDESQFKIQLLCLPSMNSRL